MSRAPLLAARDIGRISTAGTWLVRHVSLPVEAGERWAISGPTGSGKTLLLRSLALLDEVDEGVIEWNGEPVPNDRVPAFRRSVVYLHQRPVIVDGDVETNLRLAFSLKQAAVTEFSRERVLSFLEVLGRGAGFLQKQADGLSGGESQIVALLRAVQFDPEVLLLDEPTAALDAEATDAFEALVARYLDESDATRATVWVTHDRRQMERVSDHILRLEGGRVLK